MEITEVIILANNLQYNGHEICTFFHLTSKQSVERYCLIYMTVCFQKTLKTRAILIAYKSIFFFLYTYMIFIISLIHMIYSTNFRQQLLDFPLFMSQGITYYLVTCIQIIKKVFLTSYIKNKVNFTEFKDIIHQGFMV